MGTWLDLHVPKHGSRLSGEKLSTLSKVPGSDLAMGTELFRRDCSLDSGLDKHEQFDPFLASREGLGLFSRVHPNGFSHAKPPHGGSCDIRADRRCVRPGPSVYQTSSPVRQGAVCELGAPGHPRPPSHATPVALCVLRIPVRTGLHTSGTDSVTRGHNH